MNPDITVCPYIHNLPVAARTPSHHRFPFPWLWLSAVVEQTCEAGLTVSAPQTGNSVILASLSLQSAFDCGYRLEIAGNGKGIILYTPPTPSSVERKEAGNGIKHYGARDEQ